MHQILICDDDPLFHLSVKHTLKGKYEFRSAYNGDEALLITKKYPVDIILLDIQMRSPDEGLQLIPKFLQVEPDLAIVMSSGMTDFRVVREAMRLGAADYVVKDFDSEELLHTLGRVLERRSLLVKQRQHQNETQNTHQKQYALIGESAPLKNLRKMIEKIRQNQTNVVITGETGTGKELVARQLRPLLEMGDFGPFIAVDSATIQSSTAESILFGHEKGAFTGAERQNKGIFEEANGGIVYFDEIANMPLEIQAKLLRVLQEKEISRLGSSKVIQLNFRTICATNCDLEQLAREGKFKYDLLQRLNVIPVHLPPLRERTEDIPLLIQHMTQKTPSLVGSLQFTPEALEVLKAYSWPGNIRELGNLVAYLSTLVDSPEVDVADLPPKLRDLARVQMTEQKSAELGSEKQSFYKQVASFEEKLLNDAYQLHRGNISQLALALGMDRSHLYTKLKEFGIHSSRRGAGS